MKAGDLVIMKSTQFPDGFYEVTMTEVGLVIQDLGPDISGWSSQWAVLWCDSLAPKFQMEDGTSVMYESELEVISLA